MNERITKTRKRLLKEELDAFFITNQSNVMYLSGFPGLNPNEREAFILLTKKSGYFITFPTYSGLFKKEINGLEVLSITLKKRLSDFLKEIAAEDKIKTIGFEKNNLTVGELEKLKKDIKVKWKKTEGIVEEIRVYKDEDGLNKIKLACNRADKAFNFILQEIKEGISEKELSLKLEYYIKKIADDISFTPIVAFNENAAVPHYLSSANIKLKINSLILIDFGTKVDGYCSDMTRVVFFGKATKEQKRAYETVLKAQTEVINEFIGWSDLQKGPTFSGKKMDEIARKIITDNGYPEYQHGLGHGIGIDVHEDPRLSTRKDYQLKPRMVFTIEPGVYLPGKFGIRIEDTVALTEKGLEILTNSTKRTIEL
ncbi:MAG: Xaa-Pro aminopeptidase [Candidatus Gottesmanbacteria bacterium GW2011_GWC2_39_8]|uniref:Xaa-Pro aminopeptidase n=1 Tax=Candidatus Gottesmanbacteria bacterium GW2011_GWC2_39_8 TaxID=1618450 RepID=A0A0G0PV16_9BACT|nr:MAG: Xaa-Pro aminopeptidase [Candidatus Gottesmanbacteria bacterium GW2011_GWC2_39_8]